MVTRITRTTVVAVSPESTLQLPCLSNLRPKGLYKTMPAYSKVQTLQADLLVNPNVRASNRLFFILQAAQANLLFSFSSALTARWTDAAGPLGPGGAFGSAEAFFLRTAGFSVDWRLVRPLRGCRNTANRRRASGRAGPGSSTPVARASLNAVCFDEALGAVRHWSLFFGSYPTLDGASLLTPPLQPMFCVFLVATLAVSPRL